MDDARKVQFDVLFESLKYYHSGYIDTAFKITGFLVLVIGWLLTSKEARQFIAKDVVIRRFAVVGLPLWSVIYGLLSWRLYVVSQQVFRQLTELRFMPAAYYSHHVIDAGIVAASVLVNIAVTSSAAFIVARLGRQQEESPTR